MFVSNIHAERGAKKHAVWRCLWPAHLGARSVRAPRLWGILMLVLASSCISGCRAYEPMPLKPTLEWAALVQRGRENLVPADAPPTGASSPMPGLRSEWFPLESVIDIRDGIRLAEANAIALFYNPKILRARHDANVTGAQLLQAGLLENPELFLGPRFSTKTSDLILPSSLSWELPLWGQRPASRDLAGSQLKKARLDLQAKELQVLVDVRRQYFHLWSVTRELEVIDALTRTSSLIAAWVKRLDAAGEIDGTSVWLASWETSQIESLRLEKQGQRRRHANQLLRLLGLLPSTEIEVVATASDAAPDLAETSLELLRRHPLIRAAHESYEESEAALRLEITRQYPSVSLGPEFEDDSGDSSIGFGLGLELPLFDRNQGNIAAAEARRNAARDDYRAALMALAHQESEARMEAATARESLESLRQGPARDANQVLRSLEARLDLGVSGVLEVLSTQRALTDARLQEIRLEKQLAEATFSAAVAGGSALSAPTPPTSLERTP